MFISKSLNPSPLQEPTRTDPSLRPWMLAGNCWESSPKRCWNVFPSKRFSSTILALAAEWIPMTSKAWSRRMAAPWQPCVCKMSALFGEGIARRFQTNQLYRKTRISTFLPKVEVMRFRLSLLCLSLSTSAPNWCSVIGQLVASVARRWL